MNLRSIKIQVVIFLLCFAAYLSIINKDAMFLLGVSIAATTAMAAESGIGYLKEKKFKATDSSIISGLIVGFVLSSYQPMWLLALASIFAISSKHILRINKKHIFNPATFGIFISILLLRADTQWRGAYVWYILAPAGIYFILKIRKTEVFIGYALTSLILFGGQALIQKIPLFNLLGYFNYFFIFIMLIEPKTTPINTLGKLIFGMGVATLIFIFNEIGFRLDAEICSLLILNLALPLLNKLLKKYDKKEA